MTNEKLILETLANQTQRLADLQYALAGLTALVVARLPNLTPDEKVTLQNEIDDQKKDVEDLKRSADNLQRAIQGL